MKVKYLRPKQAKKAISILSKEDPFLGLLCEILYTTGRRIGEVLSLPISKCEIEDKGTSLIFKIEKKRKLDKDELEVFMTQKDWERWCKILENQGAPLSRHYFFSRTRRGQESYRATLSRYVRLIEKLAKDYPVLRELAEKKNNRFHLWRHSYVYQLARIKKESFWDAQILVGHESPETFYKYYADLFIEPSRRYAPLSDISED